MKVTSLKYSRERTGDLHGLLASVKLIKCALKVKGFIAVAT